jgi:DNA-directed RNA polymerase specialized sigma24 family protein
MLLYKSAMIPTQDDAGRPQQSTLAESAERLYESVGGVVMRTLVDRFGLSPEEAETLLRGTCSDAMKQQVRNREGWTIAAACNSAKTLRRWRDDGRSGPPPDITVEEIDALRGIVMVGKALATIPESARTALRLRFREQRSYAEIAAELDVTQKYAKLLVFRSLQRLRAGQRAEEEGEDR